MKCDNVVAIRDGWYYLKVVVVVRLGWDVWVKRFAWRILLWRWVVGGKCYNIKLGGDGFRW